MVVVNNSINVNKTTTSHHTPQMLFLYLFDRQIEELTQVVNKIEMKINDCEEENEDLRYRLGMDPREPIDLTEFRANKAKRKEEEKALNFILQREVCRVQG